MLAVAYHPEYVFSVPENHRFPMEKYGLVYNQLLYEGIIEQNQVITPSNVDSDLPYIAHEREYVQRFINLELSVKEQKTTGFIHNKKLVERELIILEGTRRLAEHALDNQVGVNIAGGTHHAFSNRGEGFCMLNDHAVAAKWLLKNHRLNRILIVDLDVHQGNGTAEIFHDDSRVFTFSMHGKNNYPLRKEKSSLDIELEDGIKDEEYLNLLDKHLSKVLIEFKPEFVFYQCGVDILECDKLGRLGMTIEGCKLRDRMVFEKIKDLNIPIVCSLGGGYSRFLRNIVNAHVNTFKEIQSIFF